MKDQNENINGLKANDAATLNFVSYQAQEAILNPNLDDDYKDWIVNAAVKKINKIADGKIIYDVRRSEAQGSLVIHEREDDKRKETPAIISQLNERLVSNAPEGVEDFTVEGFAQRMGINKSTLYEWVKTDTEFSETLVRLNKAQADDPFKTGTEEDTYVNALMVTFILLETKDRHYRPRNQ